MTRDETVALFLGCEKKRAEAREGGKSEDEAHEAAKAHWNAWAETMLAERDALENAGLLSIVRYVGLGIHDIRKTAVNKETEDWLRKSFVDFSSCHFLKKSESLTSEHMRIIPHGDNIVQFDSYIFPGYAVLFDAIFDISVTFVQTRWLCLSSA